MRILEIIAMLAVAAAPLPAQKLEFANARYASYSSLTLYAGYRAGPALVFVGFVQNPRSAYRAALLGVAKPLGRSGRSVLLGLAAATTGDGTYAQLYVLPTASLGPLTVDATAALETPLDGGPVALGVSPANVLVRVGGAWRVGATWALSATLGRYARHALGPAVVHAVPGGWLGLHVLRGFGTRPDEVWLTARVTP